jgi:hypothetical protein
VLELDAGVVRGEAPIGLGVTEVAVFDPGADLADEGFVVWNAPIEALGSQGGEFGFCQIKPGAMLGRVDPFEAVDEATSLGRGEGFVERTWRGYSGCPGAK